MPNPITQKQFDAISSRLNPGGGHEIPTHREIALDVGVSERTVCSISTGQIKRPTRQQKDPSLTVRANKPRLHDGVEIRVVAPYKCPGCRLVVGLKPCLICHERAKREREM